MINMDFRNLQNREVPILINTYYRGSASDIIRTNDRPYDLASSPAQGLKSQISR